METKFTCSKNALTKARSVFCFYAAAVPIIGFVLLIPFLLNGINRISWLAFIYVLILLFLLYKGYRAYLVLRAVRKTSCSVCRETVSGISTPDPYQKGIDFQIRKDEIILLEDKIIAAENKREAAGSSSADERGYRSIVIHTKTDTYTVFGIELTEEIKEALASE